jgi:excisionase family DNA binding protein
MKLPIEERPYYTLAEAAERLNLSTSTALNKLAAGTFPVHCYKLGRNWVVDKEVLTEFFAKRRAVGLSQLRESTAG